MRSATQLDYKERLSHVLCYMRRHLDEQLHLSTLAAVAALSPYHFQRIFSAMLGESPDDLFRRLRLERAAEQLGTTSAPITEIALRAGYATHEAFLRAFRLAFGIVPSVYRRDPIGRGALPCSNGIHYLSEPGRDIQFLSDRRELSVIVRRLPKQRAICLPHDGESWKIGQTFSKLRRLLDSADIASRPEVAIYYSDSDPDAADRQRAEAGAFVSDDLTAWPPATATRYLEAGTYAVATHVGGYDRLGVSWDTFYGVWLPASGTLPEEGPAFEVYIDNCSLLPAEECRTELYIRLKD